MKFLSEFNSNCTPKTFYLSNFQNEGENIMLKNNYQYEIALSFAGEDRNIVNEFNEQLQNIFADRIFFCDSKQYVLTAADDLKESLSEIYGEQTRCVIIFYSKSYKRKYFPKIEFKAVQERLNRENDLLWFVVCINDESSLQKSLGSTNYIKYKNNTKEIVQNITYKIITRNIENSVDNIVDITIRSRVQQGSQAHYEQYSNWCIILEKFSKENEPDWESAKKYLENYFIFAIENVKRNSNKILRLFINTHLSLAFYAGVLYGDALGMYGETHLLLKQMNKDDLDLKHVSSNDYPMPVWTRYDGNGGNDVILVIGISENLNDEMMETVKKYLMENGIQYKELSYCMGKLTVCDGAHLKVVAQDIKSNFKHSNDNKTHLFFNGPAPLMFLLGGLQRFIGTTVLYEYRMETSGTYYQSFIVGGQ